MDESLRGIFRIKSLYKALAPRAGIHHYMGAAYGHRHFHLPAERFHERLRGERTHYSGGTDNGNAPLDAEFGIECAQGEFSPSRNTDGDIHPPVIDFAYLSRNHFSRHRINGRVAGSETEAGKSHCAHALSGMENYSIMAREAHLHFYNLSMGHIGVVTPILHHLSHGRIF